MNRYGIVNSLLDPLPDLSRFATRSAVRALAIAVAALGALPLLVSTPAPFQDWPNHLARVHILDELLRGAGPWSQYYRFEGFLLPNVALDLGVLGLVRLGIPLATAGTVFLLGLYALFVAGFARLTRAFGGCSPAAPILGSVLFYNTTLLSGFINFDVGLAVSLWVIAAWLQARRTSARLAIAVLGTTATLACHVVPGVLAVGTLGLLDLVALARRRNPARHISSLAAAATMIALLLATPGPGEPKIAYVGAGSLDGLLHWKAGAYAKALLTGLPLPDLITVGLGLVLATSLAWLAVQRRVRLAIGTGPLTVLVAMALLPLAAPNSVGTGSLLDYRLAVMPFLIAFASIRVRFANRRDAALAFATLAALMLLRTGTIGLAWRDAAVEYATADAALATLPPGSLLLAEDGRRPNQSIPWFEWWAVPVAHIDTLAVQHGIVVPSTFAFAGQQPLVLRRAFLPWLSAQAADTPAMLAQGLMQARQLCGTAPSVTLAVIFPPADLAAPALRRVTSRLALIDACAG